MTHPLMNGNPVWRNEMYALHPGGITKRVLRDTFSEVYDKNGLRIQGKDADEGVITTRSEEHTSELQSLMRTSYAAFCLKHKNINQKTIPTKTIQHAQTNTHNKLHDKYTFSP